MACGAPVRDRSPASPADQRTDLQRLRELVKVDPAAALLELGVPADDFQEVAKRLYLSWKARQPPAPEPKAREQYRIENGVNVILTDHRFWCFAASPTIRMCASDRDRCDLYRAKMNPASSCTEENGMACFRSRNHVTGDEFGTCFAALSDCRIAMRAFTDDNSATIDGDCFVLRYEPNRDPRRLRDRQQK